MPELQTVFVRNSSRLPTIQTTGRVLRKHCDKTIANIVQSQNTSFQTKKMAEPEHIFHWRKDCFVSLKGQPDIIHRVLRETLRRRQEQPKTGESHLKEFDKTFYVAV